MSKKYRNYDNSEMINAAKWSISKKYQFIKQQKSMEFPEAHLKIT